MDANATLTRKLLRPKVWIPAVVLVLAAIGGVLYWFEPQALFIDQTVNEDAPNAGGDATASDAAVPESDGMMTLSGSFRSLDHPTSGKATLSKAGDGHYYVRLENFSTTDGPDLVVYLSSAESTSTGREYAENFIDLGQLKANNGNQNYQVPDDADLEQYRSVVIWCRRFTTPFGSAPLEAA